MGRPTKYTSSGGSSDVRSGTVQISHDMNASNGSNSSSGTSHLGCVITSWRQTPSPKSLLHQHLLAQHHSLHAVDAINPWLMASPDVSLSPDSTVKELEQVSSDGKDAKKRQCDANEAVNLCQKPTASSAALKVRYVPCRSSLMSPSSVACTMNCCQSLQTQVTSRWSQCSAALSIAAHADSRYKHMTNPVLNLSVKPLHLCHEKSTSLRPTTMMPFSHTDDDDDSPGSVLYFLHASCGSLFVNNYRGS